MIRLGAIICLFLIVAGALGISQEDQAGLTQLMRDWPSLTRSSVVSKPWSTDFSKVCNYLYPELKLGGWSGVLCDSNDNVVQLALNGIPLSGTISAGLRSLKRLQILDLIATGLTGTIPKWLFVTGNLEQLYAGLNRFSGGIPNSLSASSLRNLSMVYSGLTGTIPELPDTLNSLWLVGNSLNVCPFEAYPGLADCNLQNQTIRTCESVTGCTKALDKYCKHDATVPCNTPTLNPTSPPLGDFYCPKPKPADEFMCTKNKAWWTSEFHSASLKVPPYGGVIISDPTIRSLNTIYVYFTEADAEPRVRLVGGACIESTPAVKIIVPSILAFSFKERSFDIITTEGRPSNCPQSDFSSWQILLDDSVDWTRPEKPCYYYSVKTVSQLPGKLRVTFGPPSCVQHQPSSAPKTNNGTSSSTKTVAIVLPIILVLIIIALITWYAITHTNLRHKCMKMCGQKNVPGYDFAYSSVGSTDDPSELYDQHRPMF